MEDEGKTKKQLISEVVEMRQCDAALNATKTERRQRGVDRRESEARFRNLLDYIPGVSIQGYTTDGIVRYWNKASEQIYGYTAEEAIGRNLGDLIIPPEVKHQFKQALELGAKCTCLPANSCYCIRTVPWFPYIPSIRLSVWMAGPS
jgi:PAS domain-containing protein